MAAKLMTKHFLSFSQVVISGHTWSATGGGGNTALVPHIYYPFRHIQFQVVHLRLQAPEISQLNIHKIFFRKTTTNGAVPVAVFRFSYK